MVPQSGSIMSHQQRAGLTITDSIRSSSNNDNRNNTDSPTLPAAWAEGARGEWGTQFLETDWENITFLALYLLPLHPLFVSTHCGAGDGTHQPAFGLDQRSVLAVHFVVQPAGVAQIVSGAVTSPQRRRGGSTVYTLAALWRKTRTDIRHIKHDDTAAINLTVPWTLIIVFVCVIQHHRGGLSLWVRRQNQRLHVLVNKETPTVYISRGKSLFALSNFLSARNLISLTCLHTIIKSLVTDFRHNGYANVFSESVQMTFQTSPDIYIT